MKKGLLILGCAFTLCGCSIFDDTVKDMNSTKYGLAKNSVNGYASAVKTAYTDYQYASVGGNYVPNENSVPVIINGQEVRLNVTYYGDNVECSGISITNNHITIDECIVYGYKFKYEDGKAIEK